MNPLLPSWSLAAALVSAAIVSAQSSPSPARAIKALGSWMNAYHGGKLDLNVQALKSTAVGVRAGFIAKDEARKVGHGRELEAICAVVAEGDGAEAACALLPVAAVGLDADCELGPVHNPAFVRHVGERFLARLAAPDALEQLAAVAGGSEGDDTLRAAALRDLGGRRSEAYRDVLERALAADEPCVRLGAAEGIYRSQLISALDAVAGRIGREEDRATLTRLLQAARHLVIVNPTMVHDQHRQAVTHATLVVLGRSSWRVDLAAVELLERMRHVDAVPALIDVLARCGEQGAANGDAVSGTLQHAAFEALASLTGATLPIDDADRWRQWWADAKAGFHVADEPKVSHHKTSSGFFGIPVRGSRVLFVVDTSGSMNFPKEGKPGARGSLNDKELKLDIAKRELALAVENLPEETAINLVQFGARAKAWQKELVPASERTKKRFLDFVEKLRADGGTNLWEGLATGLKADELGVGATWGEPIDELFILSDGLPSPGLGEVYDPKEILRMVREVNEFARVKINTIYISGDPELERKFADQAGMSGAELMRGLAEQSGGTFLEF